MFVCLLDVSQRESLVVFGAPNVYDSSWLQEISTATSHCIVSGDES